MRGAIALLLGALAVGCTTSVEVSYDESEDFARFRTWNWLPHGNRSIDAPEDDPRALDRTVTRLVESAFEERGFERVDLKPDLLVSYFLRVRRQFVVNTSTPAMQTLSSLHSSPSYAIQTTETEFQVYENGALAIVVAERVGLRVIWDGVLRGRHRDEFSPHLDEAVAQLLEGFPPTIP